MSKCILTCLFLSCWLLSEAQPPEGAGPNLIPNPSFETVQGKRPGDDVDGSAAFRVNMVDWRSPTKSTPDLKIVLPHELEKAKRAGLPHNTTHTGYKMVAILTHNPKSERSDTYREYIQCKLDKPTKVGKEYYYEFWVCLDIRSKFASNNIGFVLSPSPIAQIESWTPLTDYTPDFNVTEVINQDERKWVKYSGTIKSANRSFYFILGNFFDNEKTTMVEHKEPGDFENSYYLIDDIALHEVYPEPEAVAPPPPKVGAVVKLDRIFFVTAKWDLLPESNAQLDEVVALLNEYPDMEIEIQGHTDDRGDDDYNLTLSKNRAKSVYKYVIAQGIAKERLKYRGYGEGKPVADNGTSEGRQLNRRVEFVVTKIGDDNLEVEYETDVKPYTDDE